jgi:hypothetical protein
MNEGTNIECEAITLQKEPQIRILAKDRMVCSFLDAFLQSHSPLPYKLAVESTKGVFFWYRRNNYTRVVVREGFVQPKEVGVASKDGER